MNIDLYIAVTKSTFMELLLPEVVLIFWLLFSLFIIILPIIALISLLMAHFKDSTTKLIWLLVIIFVPFFGPILYFVVGRKQRIKVA